MSEFFAMGGYAAYVWSAYGITALVLTIHALVARNAARRALGLLAAEQEEHDDAAA